MVGKSKAKQVQTVDAYMAALEHPLKAEVEAVRQMILGASDQIREEVKWNAPSFTTTEHFATFNLHANDLIQVILHRGAKAKDGSSKMEIDDPQGIVEWLAADRGMVKFRSMEDVFDRRAAFENIIRQWVEKM